jgi:hypothetical protein
MAGKILGTIFGLIFMGFGIAFSFLVLRASYQTLQTYRWQEIPCTVLSSEITDSKDSDKSHRVSVKFTYTADGRNFTSEWAKGFSDYSEAQRTVDRYRAGSTVKGYLDPDRPGQVILQRKSLWALSIVLLPMLFVVVGGGVVIGAWKYKPREQQALSEAAPKPTRVWASMMGLGCFFSVFFLAGAAMLFFLFLRPAYRVYQAQHWIETPCKIISSEVASHSGDDSTTYSIEVLFSYTYGGREYKSSRYDLSAGGSSGGYESKQKVVDQLPAGKDTVCYVNPDDAVEAALNRGFTSNIWVGLFSLPFLLAGLGGYIFVFVGRKKLLSQPSAQWKPESDISVAPEVPVTGQVVLKPKQTPISKFITALVVCVIWNGIVGVFVYFVLAGNDTPFIAWIFVGVFGLIGLAILVNVPYQFLALFNPKPILTVTPGSPHLGDRVNVEWAFSRKSELIQTLQIVVEGREEARYRRGTSTYTDKNTFTTIVLVDTQSSMEVARGNRSLSIPEDTMHSFEGTNNKIIWTIKMTGSIKNWPDIDEEFPLVVQPVALASISRR